MTNTVGISATGFAVPYHRISTESVRSVWDNAPESVVVRMGVVERGVLDPDADVITLAIEAGRQALAGHTPTEVDAVILGSQTAPYIGGANAAIVAEALLCGSDTFTCDVRFSGKSGTAALINAVSLVQSGMAGMALAIGADALGVHAAPGDSAELTAGCGAAAVLVTRNPTLAVFETFASVSSDTPDFFRLDGERYIRSGGAVMTATGEGEANHMAAAWTALLNKSNEPADFQHLAAQQTTASSYKRLGARLRLEKEACRAGLHADRLGDIGAGAPLLSFIGVLEQARAGHRAGILSYGAGAGADALSFSILSSIQPASLARQLERRQLIDYPTALRFERRYHGHSMLMGTFE